MEQTSQWTGKWCWVKNHLARPWNTYVYFRRTVELPNTPAAAIMRVSADARYTLYVNGQRLHQGPARCYPEHQSFDTLDLKPHESPMQHDLVHDPWAQQDGLLALRDEPGLGVSVRQDAVDRYVFA